MQSRIPVIGAVLVIFAASLQRTDAVACGNVNDCTAATGTCEASTGTCWCVNGFGGTDCALTCDDSGGLCPDLLCYTDATTCTPAADCTGDDAPCETDQGTCMSYDDGTTPGVKCQCEANFAGTTCSLECTDGCDNGGTCIDNSGAECSCTIDYYGTSCTERKCTADGDLACQNGGTCPTSGECGCTDDYIGDLCQMRKCSATQVCQNGGTCGTTDSICVCADAYIGDLCHLTKCTTAVPCQNEGTCTGGMCTCPATHEGDLCQSGSGRAVQTLSMLLMATSCWLLL